jgi:hypothetical protein
MPKLFKVEKIIKRNGAADLAKKREKINAAKQ